MTLSRLYTPPPVRGERCRVCRRQYAYRECGHPPCYVCSERCEREVEARVAAEERAGKLMSDGHKER